MSLYVGTSGYSYKEWKGKFYPEELSAKDMLTYYSEHFQAVELNNTFYRTPKPNMIETWKSQVPDNFRFTVKASQGITHFRRLRDAAYPTRLMLETISALDDRLGAVIFRLPADMKKDLERLKTFLKHLPREAVVDDIVYVPLETDLLKQAKARGNATVDGIGMLLHQAGEVQQDAFTVRRAQARPHARFESLVGRLHRTLDEFQRRIQGFT